MWMLHPLFLIVAFFFFLVRLQLQLMASPTLSILSVFPFFPLCQ